MQMPKCHLATVGQTRKFCVTQHKATGYFQICFRAKGGASAPLWTRVLPPPSTFIFIYLFICLFVYAFYKNSLVNSLGDWTESLLKDWIRIWPEGKTTVPANQRLLRNEFGQWSKQSRSFLMFNNICHQPGLFQALQSVYWLNHSHVTNQSRLTLPKWDSSVDTNTEYISPSRMACLPWNHLEANFRLYSRASNIR